MTLQDLTTNQFDDLVMREMRQGTLDRDGNMISLSDAEVALLHAPESLYKWRHVLKRKMDQSKRHIDSRDTTVEAMRLSLRIDTDADLDDLTEEEYNQYMTLREEVAAKNVSSKKFNSYVEDALERVGELIRNTPHTFDPAEIAVNVCDIRDALTELRNALYEADESPSARALDAWARATFHADNAIDIISAGSGD